MAVAFAQTITQDGTLVDIIPLRRGPKATASFRLVEDGFVPKEYTEKLFAYCIPVNGNITPTLQRQRFDLVRKDLLAERLQAHGEFAEEHITKKQDIYSPENLTMFYLLAGRFSNGYAPLPVLTRNRLAIAKERASDIREYVTSQKNKRAARLAAAKILIGG